MHQHYLCQKRCTVTHLIQITSASTCTGDINTTYVYKHGENDTLDETSSIRQEEERIDNDPSRPIGSTAKKLPIFKNKIHITVNSVEKDNNGNMIVLNLVI